MAESINISRLRGPSTLLRYGLAVLAVSAATIIQQFGDEHFAVTPSYFCAVLLTAWLGGLGPALFAIALSNLALMYYFVPPTRTFVIDAKYISSLILFSLAALFVTWLSGRERGTTRSLAYARNQLDLKIHEINKTNEALQAEITERKRAEERLRVQHTVAQVGLGGSGHDRGGHSENTAGHGRVSGMGRRRALARGPGGRGAALCRALA